MQNSAASRTVWIGNLNRFESPFLIRTAIAHMLGDEFPAVHIYVPVVENTPGMAGNKENDGHDTPLNRGYGFVEFTTPVIAQHFKNTSGRLKLDDLCLQKGAATFAVRNSNRSNCEYAQFWRGNPLYSDHMRNLVLQRPPSYALVAGGRTAGVPPAMNAEKKRQFPKRELVFESPEHSDASSCEEESIINKMIGTVLSVESLFVEEQTGEESPNVDLMSPTIRDVKPMSCINSIHSLTEKLDMALSLLNGVKGSGLGKCIELVGAVKDELSCHESRFIDWGYSIP